MIAILPSCSATRAMTAARSGRTCATVPPCRRSRPSETAACSTTPVSRALYALRNRIECFINRLRNGRRGATRYDHAADSFSSSALPPCPPSGSRIAELSASSTHGAQISMHPVSA